MYNIISENGGFDNWNIRVLQIYNCKDVDEVRKILCNYSGYILETEKMGYFHCEACVFETNRKLNYDTHCKTKKHLTNEMNKNSNQPVQQQSQINELSKIVIDITKQSSKAQDELTQLVIDELTQLVIDLTNETNNEV